GSRFAFGGTSRRVRLVELRSGETREVGAMPSELAELRFTADGKALAAAASDGTIRIWTLDAGHDASPRELHAAGKLQDLLLAPDGHIVGAGDHVELWDPRGGSSLRPPVDSGATRTAALSPDGSLVAYGSLDMIVHVWDWRRGTVRDFAGHQGLINRLAFSPDGTRLASSRRDATVRAWY